jgi:chromosome segregation ATPase
MTMTRDKIYSEADMIALIEAETEKLRAEIERLRTANEYAFSELTATRAEIERLKEALQVQTEGIYEIIAEWANEEGIGFDQTARLSKALGLEPKP